MSWDQPHVTSDASKLRQKTLLPGRVGRSDHN